MRTAPLTRNLIHKTHARSERIATTYLTRTCLALLAAALLLESHSTVMKVPYFPNTINFSVEAAAPLNGRYGTRVSAAIPDSGSLTHSTGGSTVTDM